MNDHELDQLVTQANPISDARVSRLRTSEAARELLEQIVTTSVPTPAPHGPRIPGLQRRSRRLVLVAAVIAGVLALSGLLLPRGGPGTQAAYAAEMVAVANANPRLLVASPGWVVTGVDEFDTTSGGTTFSNGTAELDVSWVPAALYPAYEDRTNNISSREVELLGQTGTTFRYGDSTRFTTVLPPTGENFLEIDGDLGSEDAYQELIGRLHPVDVTTWLDAMPDSVVMPTDIDAEVADMLSDIPLPASFDTRTLNDETTQDRYQLGVAVSGAVACAWIEQWLQAESDGNDQAAREAVDALESSRDWTILQQMAPEGDYPEVVWWMSDDITQGKLPAHYTAGLGCS